MPTRKKDSKNLSGLVMEIFPSNLFGTKEIEKPIKVSLNSVAPSLQIWPK